MARIGRSTIVPMLWGQKGKIIGQSVKNQHGSDKLSFSARTLSNKMVSYRKQIAHQYSCHKKWSG